MATDQEYSSKTTNRLSARRARKKDSVQPQLSAILALTGALISELRVGLNSRQTPGIADQPVEQPQESERGLSGKFAMEGLLQRTKNVFSNFRSRIVEIERSVDARH